MSGFQLPALQHCPCHALLLHSCVLSGGSCVLSFCLEQEVFLVEKQRTMKESMAKEDETTVESKGKIFCFRKKYFDPIFAKVNGRRAVAVFDPSQTAW